MKTFFSTLTGFIVAILLAAVIIGFIGWSRLPDIIANNLSKKLQVTVEIGDMGLQFNAITIDKVIIGNPPNTILSKAFSCRSIDILTPLNRYLNQEIIIDQINVNDVYLGLEFDSASGATGNWTRIMSNFKSSTGQDPDKGDKKNPPPSQESQRSVLIQRLILTNIDVDVVYRKEGGKIKKLPRIDRIELTNISSEGGVPMDQVMNSVLGQMLKSVFEKQNLQNMFQNLLQNSGIPKQIPLPFPGLWNYQMKPDDDHRSAIAKAMHLEKPLATISE